MLQAPQHIAIIMDGNGRWAQQRSHPRTYGHIRGAKRAQEITRECARLGVQALTLYTFSTENWQRPSTEVSFLMRLLQRYIRSEGAEIISNNLRFQTIGFTEMLPQNVVYELKNLEAACAKNTGMILSLALSYGSRQEIIEATKKIAQKTNAGILKVEEISESIFTNHLFTHNLPELDLLIRTGGNQRVSNFLLWQMAYAELYFTECFWPDFTVEQLHKATGYFSQVERRFGRVLENQLLI